MLEDVDVSNFPLVSFKVNVYNPKEKSKSAFEVVEHGKPVDFDIETIPVDITDKSKVVLILFEDMLSHGKQRQVFKYILDKSLPKIVNKGDLYNIAFFDRNRDGATPLQFANEKFTDNPNLLQEKINNYNHKPDRFNQQKSSDLYNAIYDGITYLKDNFEGKNKLIVVMSGGKNLELSNYNSISDIISYAKKYKIPIYSLQYMVYEHENIDALANNTYGKYFHIQGTYKLKGDHSKEVAEDSLVSFMNKAVAQMQGKNYMLTYKSAFDRDGKLHVVSVKTDESVKDISFSAPPCDMQCWLEKNREKVIYAGGGILLFLLLFGLLLKRSLNKRRKNRLLATENIKKTLERQEEELLEQKQKALEIERIALEEKRKHEEEKRQLLIREQEKREQERINKIINQMKAVKGFSKLRVVTDGGFFDWEISYPEIFVGKNADNNLVIKDKTVSGKHFKIFYKNNEYTIVDLNSLNGTFVNGQKVKEKKLRHNDTIQIGKTKMLFIL